MPKVILMVGPSGVGKSSWVTQFSEFRHTIVCSADRYHMVDVVDEHGMVTEVYKFDPTKASQAHSHCMREYLRALQNPKVDYVIVDNTNVSQWERQNYVAAAISHKLEIQYVVWKIRTIEEVKLCAARNKHGVSPGLVADMALRQDFDSALALLYAKATVCQMSLKF